MSVIKSGSAVALVSVRPISIPPPAPVVVLQRSDEERETLRRTVASLEALLRERDIAIDVLRKDVRQAFDDGRAEGHAVGLTSAQDRQAERLAALDRAARAAAGGVAAGLRGLERLAPLLAIDCIDKILGDGEARAEMIGGIVGVQVAGIDKAMLLAIDVSREDFPDDAALAGLVERLAPSSVTLLARADMPSGGCVMTLRLGRMTVGIDQQWGTLASLLADMAQPGSAG